METVADLLEDARKKAGITQEYLGEQFRAGGGKGSNGTVEGWLRGWREPKVSNYNLLAKILNKHLKKAGSKARLPVLSNDVRQPSLKLLNLNNSNQAA